MIKMTIAGEEVVSNKEFTITEEMLATSSTILNNCYPKTWEQDHDYVSRFYYPKDYSKCLIYKDTPILPKEYTQVDCLKLTGTQYIDTGVYGNLETELVATAIRTTTGNMQIFGDISSNNRAISCNIGSASTSTLNRFGSATVYIIYKNYIEQDKQFTIKENKTGIYIDGVRAGSLNATADFTTQRTLLLGTRNGSSLSNFWVGSIYSCQIYDNGTLIRNFVPCYRNSDKVVGMYDLANDVFYTNAGTGVFTYNQEQIETETTLIFSGVVKNSGNISLRPTEPKYCSLQILDFKTFLSEGETLDFVINNKTVLQAIQMVTDAISQYGFVLGNVNIIGGDEVIGAYSTQEKTAYDVFQYLADITQSRWYTRMIDENTVAIDFYDPTLMPQGLDIDYTEQYFEENQVIDLTFNYGTRDYRNKQVMLSNEVFGGVDYEETIIADGYNKVFSVTTNIGLLKAITVNGVSMTFATNEEKVLGTEADFYYTIGTNQIEANDTIYASNSVIIVSYTPLVKGRQVVYNTDEVNRINSQTDRKGVIARYEQRNDVLSAQELEKIGQTYIKYKGSPEIILTLQTQTNIYDIGEVVHFNAPINDLDTDYMVKKKSTQIIATGDYSNIFYTYELTSSFNSESAINYFDNQRAKTSGNITSGEYITRNIDIENIANIIWDNLTITEVTPSGDNILNSPLNSPFTQ